MTGIAVLSDVQDVDVNYYVLVPFTTSAAAEWAAGEIEAHIDLDCHVVGAAAVDQNALTTVPSVGGESQ